MTSPIEKQTQQHPALAVSAAVTREREACTLPPPGWECPKYAGHDGPCAAAQVNNTEPPDADTPQEVSAPAASSAPQRKYGIKKRKEFDFPLPSGGFVRVRQLTMPRAIELGILNMKDSFAAKLLKDINDTDQELSDEAAEELEEALKDPTRRENFFGPLNRIAVAALVCPTAILDGEATGEDQIHVDDVELIDKVAIFEAAMPDEMKSAALEEQHDALKSLRGQQDSGV
jgi:hypothetical protein